MDKYCITSNYTINEAVDNINTNNQRAAIVLNENKKVIGVISQGDIIRALADGRDFYSRIKGLVRPNFYYLNEKDMSVAYRIFRDHMITLLPIVDDKFNLIDVVTIGDIYTYMEARRNG